MTSPTTDILESRESGGLRRVSAFGVVLAAIVVGLLSAGFVSSAVAADTCVNAAVRVQTDSTELPDCRAFEMVSTPYKEGFPIYLAGGIAFTDDGVVSYQSRGAFAGNAIGSPNNLYHATRSAAGWTTSSMEPPGAIYNTSLGDQSIPVLGESADLRWSLWHMFRRADESVQDSALWVRGPDGVFTRIGDGSVGELSGSGLPNVAMLTLHTLAISGSSEYVGTGNGGPPRPAGIYNNGQSTPGASCVRAFSPDGRVIAFTSGCSGTGTSQVWARVGGSATVAVSGSECTRDAGDVGGLCNGVSAATYWGGAVDGSPVFFTTGQQLVNDDIDQTNDLYACDIPAGAPVPVGLANPCASLTEVSGTATDAQVENVVAVSEDASRVYFVAQGVLADNLGVSDVGPATGVDAHNLYMWERDSLHPAGQTRFVARLADAGNDLTRAQMTPDGRYLLFVTANRLGDGDTDTAKDVYRYDAGAHKLVRVSASVSGGGGGNGLGFDVSIPGASAMSADGSTVIFDTAEALAQSDTDGVGDVYSWRDGQVSLISAGGGSAMGVTPSGRDIFLLTDAPVLGADRDANTDVYDARVGGGFAPAPTPPPCFGDQCQGERGQPPSLAARSAVGSGGALVRVARVFSLRAVSAAQRRALAATGKISLTVTTNTPGTINANATATIAGRSATVGSGRRTLTAPGRVAVTLTLFKKARARLVARGRLTVKIAVSHSKVALDRAVTLKLVHAKPNTKKSAKRAQRSVMGVGGSRS